MKTLKKCSAPILILLVFETVAVTLRLTKNKLLYLRNFSNIGLSIIYRTEKCK